MYQNVQCSYKITTWKLKLCSFLIKRINLANVKQKLEGTRTNSFNHSTSTTGLTSRLLLVLLGILINMSWHDFHLEKVWPYHQLLGGHLKHKWKTSWDSSITILIMITILIRRFHRDHLQKNKYIATMNKDQERNHGSSISLF